MAIRELEKRPDDLPRLLGRRCDSIAPLLVYKDRNAYLQCCRKVHKNDVEHAGITTDNGDMTTVRWWAWD